MRKPTLQSATITRTASTAIVAEPRTCAGREAVSYKEQVRILPRMQVLKTWFHKQNEKTQPATPSPSAQETSVQPAKVLLRSSLICTAGITLRLSSRRRVAAERKRVRAPAARWRAEIASSGAGRGASASSLAITPAEASAASTAPKASFLVDGVQWL